MRFQLCQHSCQDGVLVHAGASAPGRLPSPRPPWAQPAAPRAASLPTPVRDHRTHTQPDSLNSALPGKGHDPTEQLFSFTLQTCLLWSSGQRQADHVAREQTRCPVATYLPASIYTAPNGRKRIILSSVIFKNVHALLIKKHKLYSYFQKGFRGELKYCMISETSMFILYLGNISI